jgi:hypothetical protein
VYRIFEPGTKTSRGIGEYVSKVIEAVRTGVASKFRPIDKLSEDISKAYGVATKKGLAGIFEQLKGSSGKGEANVYRFDKEVSDLVKGNERDFNAYMFLNRSLDRLRKDLSTGETRRKVSGYSIPELESKLATLESNLTPEQRQNFNQASIKYQQHMDQALRLQVESGRMSPELYSAIKEGNQFYAPFKVMKYLEETSRPEGTGAKIDTVAEFTKAMTGIEDPSFRLGDMLSAARQNILVSEILANKNQAMRKLAALQPVDVNGLFIRKLGETESIPHGMDAVNVLEGGKKQRYAVNRDVSESIQTNPGVSSNFIASVLSKFSGPFRLGATALNLPFQVANIMADVPRQFLVSKYGVNGVSDLVRYPLDLVESAYTSIKGNVLGQHNQLFQDFLDSGVALSTIQEHLTPSALQFRPFSSRANYAKSVLYTIPNFSTAIEQTSKIVGVNRAMRFHGARTGKELAANVPESITEIRRFSGSPDFGRQGKWTEQARLNLIYMFLNARIQGATADIGRLIGRDGSATAAKTWGKLGVAVGTPTLLLYALNTSDQYGDDFSKRPSQERENYWLIPKDNFIVNEQGERVRDYYRVPKRETAKLIANILESSLDFARKRDGKAFARWATSMVEDISPVNIQGKTLQERLESVGASLNPVIKAPMETATGRDFYRHRDIVPEVQQRASPEEQYTDRTAKAFKTLANWMPDYAPDVFRSPLMLENMTRNLTAGLFTQFLPRKPVEGRGPIENTALLQRFQGLPYTDNVKFQDEMRGLERMATDEYLARHRLAVDALKQNKGKPITDIARQVFDKNPDPKLIRHLVDLWVGEQRGVTSDDRRLIALPAPQRAAYIANKLKSLPQDQRVNLIQDYANKRILTEQVIEEMNQIK